MPRKPETGEERQNRLIWESQEHLREAQRQRTEDDELDVMVRKSIKLHGP
jgi:hypothetical protein